MKMRLEMKNKSRRYDINRPRPRQDTNTLDIKFSKYNDGYMY